MRARREQVCAHQVLLLLQQCQLLLQSVDALGEVRFSLPC